MGKISLVSAKYIVHADINIEGVVDRPDVIGAIFGQTEGLLGSELELRELQRSGRIGRIEVSVETRGGKTNGTIIIPSSLDKAETSIVGAALEIIQRIGPCDAKIKVNKIEDVRVSKRRFVIERAKELLKHMMDSVMPDSQELSDEVTRSVRAMEIVQYGKDRLPAGPYVESSDDVILVEGRADVLNLLKNGIKNCIAMNGTSVPETIIELSKRKILTVFADGDRGGDLNIKELIQVAEIDFVCKAPDGKEVEEITKKEIHKALKGKVALEQYKMDIGLNGSQTNNAIRSNTRYQQPTRPVNRRRPSYPQQSSSQRPSRPVQRERYKKVSLSADEKKKFKEILEDLIGTKGAYILDDKLETLGRLPVSELVSTIKSMSSGIHAVVLDGNIDRALVQSAELTNVKFVVGMDSKIKDTETKVNIVTIDILG